MSRIPKLLVQVMDWEKQIAPEASYLEWPSGLLLSFDENDNGSYMCSPADSIMFASTGCDGVHYSLLTDFGKHSNLEEAPVIRVTPMDFDEPVKIVANNLRDFFALTFNGHADLLFNDFETEEVYLRFREEEEKDRSTEYFDHKKWKEQKQFVNDQAIKEFQLEPINNPVEYINEIREARNNQVVLHTKDLLGVVALSEEAGNKVLRNHPWSNTEVPELMTEEVRYFIEHSELEALLSFVRDYQTAYVQDSESLGLLCKQLQAYGLFGESVRLLNCMGH